jgi:dienelactone hydrolase
MKHGLAARRWGLLAAAALLTATVVLAQSFAPPPSKPPKESVLKTITAKIVKLDRALRALRRQKIRDPWIAEIEIYLKAATWVVRENEFYQPETAAWTIEALDRGYVRARQVAQGESPWVNAVGHPVIRAYRSRIDNSVQPYAITFPPGYERNREKKWRLDVVLHGRDPSLNEVKFLHQFNGDQDAPRGQTWVQLDIFGRGNNAYRWAGETDVFEAVEGFLAVERLLGGRDQKIDLSRVVLRGFSMGGAGTWHLGLHRPDKWCVLGPGAGFTTTKGYVPNLGELTPAQEACLHIYDAVDYAENAFDVPIVAYAGSEDKQLQAARNIEAQLKKLKLSKHMELLVAKGLGHKFPDKWRARAEEKYARAVKKGRPEYPERVRFVTYTLKYPSCAWVEILSLDRHYRRAHVDAVFNPEDKNYTVKTANVRALHLTLTDEANKKVVLTIDDQPLRARATVVNNVQHLYLEKRAGRWKSAMPQKLGVERLRHAQKVSGLQGPIDDAFMEAFLCVRGTGERPWHTATQKYAEANLKRFQQEWSKFMRGQLPVKDDVDVDADDITNKHLILFGDPASNSLIAEVLDGLPLKWTEDAITVAGKKYDAASHVPVLIYPSPLNANRYVVLNSGHTFHAAEWVRSNALLFPRLGDYAVLKLRPTEKDPLRATVAASGLYDDYWQYAKR